MRHLRNLRHFVRNYLKMWALQLYQVSQVSQLSHAFFCSMSTFSGQDKGQEERERGTEVPRSKRNKKCTGRSFAISAIFASANFHKERQIGFA